MKIFTAILLLLSTSAFAGEFDWDVNKSVHENVLAMDYKLQIYTLAFLVKESGHSCKPILRGYQGDTEEGDHYWVVGCLDGTDWSVMLADDGYQVMKCKLFEKLSGNSCLATF